MGDHPPRNTTNAAGVQYCRVGQKFLVKAVAVFDDGAGVGFAAFAVGPCFPCAELAVVVPVLKATRQEGYSDDGEDDDGEVYEDHLSKVSRLMGLIMVPPKRWTAREMKDGPCGVMVSGCLSGSWLPWLILLCSFRRWRLACLVVSRAVQLILVLVTVIGLLWLEIS